MEEPVRPVVRLVASSAPPRPERVAPEVRGRPASSRLAVLAVLLGVLTVSGRPEAPRPAPAEPGLVLRVDVAGLGGSQAGVLVVPVRLVNDGPAVRVLRGSVYAEPVREDPLLDLPAQLGAGERRRVVAVIAPDCRLLRTGALRFGASVLVRVQSGSVRRDVVLDLVQPEVRDRVRGLCSGPQLGPQLGSLTGLVGG